MDDAIDDEMIAGLARPQVTQLVPQELPLFRAQSAAYFRDPQQALRPAKERDEMLGFGVEAAVVLITPVILEVSKAVLRFVADEVRKSLKEESPALIRQVVRSLLRRVMPGAGGAATAAPGAPPGAAATSAAPAATAAAAAVEPAPAASPGAAPAGFTLSVVQLRELRRTAFDRAKQLNLADDRAALLADSLVGSLALT